MLFACGGSGGQTTHERREQQGDAREGGEERGYGACSASTNTPPHLAEHEPVGERRGARRVAAALQRRALAAERPAVDEAAQRAFVVVCLRCCVGVVGMVGVGRGSGRGADRGQRLATATTAAASSCTQPPSPPPPASSSQQHPCTLAPCARAHTPRQPARQQRAHTRIHTRAHTPAAHPPWRAPPRSPPGCARRRAARR